MNTIQELLSTYGVLGYGITVFFGGRWGLKFFNYFEKTKYNFLVFATLYGALWIVVEVLSNTFKPIDIGRYLLTYAVVTSCYELVADMFPFLKKKDETKP